MSLFYPILFKAVNAPIIMDSRDSVYDASVSQTLISLFQSTKCYLTTDEQTSVYQLRPPTVEDATIRKCPYFSKLLYSMQTP